MVGLLWQSEADHRLGTHRGTFRLIDFVVAMRLLAVARGASGTLEGDDFAGMSAAILATLLHELAAEGTGGLALLRLCRSLGMNREDRRRAGVEASKKQIGEVGPPRQAGTAVRDRVNAAKTAATIARMTEGLRDTDGAGFPEGDGDGRLEWVLQQAGITGARRREVEDLRDWSFDTLTVKATDIKEYLRRPLTDFIQRGASAWCSQTTARLRDRLLRPDVHPSDALLLVDCDALVVVVSGARLHLDHVASTVEALLRESYGSSAISADYPRLAPWLARAREAGMSLDDVNPNLQVSVRTASLLDVVIDCTRKEVGFEPTDTSEIVTQRALPAPPGPRCVFAGSPAGSDGNPAPSAAFDLEADEAGPDWLLPHRKLPLGVAATCWSLIGSSYRMATTEGLVREVEDELRATGVAPRSGLRTAWSKRELLQLAGNGSETYFLVKIDGTEVGASLIETPSLSRPGFGSCLELDLHDRWTGAVTALARANLEAEREALPVDLIYFGGDDAQFAIAGGQLEAFLTALGEGNPKLGRPAQTRYRLAALELRPRPGRNEAPSAGPPYVPHPVAERTARALLDAAKTHKGMDVPETVRSEFEVASEAYNRVRDQPSYDPPPDFPWSALSNRRPSASWNVLVLRFGDQTSETNGS